MTQDQHPEYLSISQQVIMMFIEQSLGVLKCVEGLSIEGDLAMDAGVTEGHWDIKDCIHNIGFLYSEYCKLLKRGFATSVTPTI